MSICLYIDITAHMECIRSVIKVSICIREREMYFPDSQNAHGCFFHMFIGIQFNIGRNL